MKTKSIIFSGLLLASLGVATTSCEDVLSVEDELHTTNLAPQDTVYHLLGIVNRIQSLADRTVILGELRADLVDIDPTVAKTSLQDVMNNNISVDNEFNQISDYYSVINACNIYLKYVDSTYVSHNQLHYEKEIQAVRVFRAWTYLEMAKTYGSVPFVLDPVLSSATGDEILNDKSNRADMNQICTYFINELLPYASKTIEVPTVEKSGALNGHQTRLFFIPSRLMLAELYLWRGCFTQSQADCVEACKYYHDYLSYNNKEITTGTGGISWDRQFRNPSGSLNYAGDERVAIIPLDTCAYDGTWSQLYGIFNSQFENNYFVPVVPSKYIRELSQEQIFCLYYEELGDRDTLYSTMKEEWEDSIEMGDLRLQYVFDQSQVSDRYTDRFAKDRQHIMKYATSTANTGPDRKIEYLTLYRRQIVWLHFAEALNRAGFPMTAFTILKYGMSSSVLNNNEYVLWKELAALQQIPTYFRGNLSAWDETIFVDPHSPYASQPGVSVTMQGIHSRGCGDSEYNDFYTLPYDSVVWANVFTYRELNDSLTNALDAAIRSHETTTITQAEADVYTGKYILQVANQDDQYRVLVFESDSDSIAFNDLYVNQELTYNNMRTAEENAYDSSLSSFSAAVEQMILDEEALEGAFEGYRFYDLMRHAMWVNDPDYIANQVARRKGAAEYDTRADALKGGKWYLPLP